MSKCAGETERVCEERERKEPLQGKAAPSPENKQFNGLFCKIFSFLFMSQNPTTNLSCTFVYRRENGRPKRCALPVCLPLVHPRHPRVAPLVVCFGLDHRHHLVDPLVHCRRELQPVRSVGIGTEVCLLCVELSPSQVQPQPQPECFACIQFELPREGREDVGRTGVCSLRPHAHADVPRPSKWANSIYFDFYITFIL